MPPANKNYLGNYSKTEVGQVKIVIYRQFEDVSRSFINSAIGNVAKGEWKKDRAEVVEYANDTGEQWGIDTVKIYDAIQAEFDRVRGIE
jgi:hypothetical protein